MTGAALIPGGISGGRPGTPSGGMFRYNTTLNPDTMEFYDSTQSSWIALATLPQLQGVAIDAYSNFSASTGGGVYTDISPTPGFDIRNTITVPAGYTNFLVYASLAPTWGYNTGGYNGTTVFNMIWQNGAGSNYGLAAAYQASSVNGGSDSGNTQIPSSCFVYLTSSASVSNTFNQTTTKLDPRGPIIPYDSNFVVLAWAI
jgi:hypothetical protein